MRLDREQPSSRSGGPSRPCRGQARERERIMKAQHSRPTALSRPLSLAQIHLGPTSATARKRSAELPSHSILQVLLRDHVAEAIIVLHEGGDELVQADLE